MACLQAYVGATVRVRLAALLALSLAALPACERTTRDTDIKFMSVSEAKNLFDRVNRGETTAAAFIDPRPAKEFTASHIPGARNLTLPQVKPKSKPDPRLMEFSVLIVYGNDPASATARGMTKRLIEVGYDKIRFFAGGLKDWNQRNYPLDKAAATTPPRSSPSNPDPAAATPAATSPDHPEKKPE
jgi:rhodanese-related sulfurtransferase